MLQLRTTLSAELVYCPVITGPIWEQIQRSEHLLFVRSSTCPRNSNVNKNTAPCFHHLPGHQFLTRPDGCFQHRRLTVQHECPQQHRGAELQLLPVGQSCCCALQAVGNLLLYGCSSQRAESSTKGWKKPCWEQQHSFLLSEAAC